MCGTIWRVGITSSRCWCRRVDIRGNDALLSTNNADDSVVGEEEKCGRQDVVQDHHRQRVGVVHCRSRPLEPQAFAVDHWRCGPGRDEVTADTVNPRQDDSRVRHPTTVVVPVGDRVNDLDVALDGDDDQTEDGTVRDNGHDRLRLEQQTDDPLDSYRSRLEVIHDNGEY